jgi:N-acyl homoserine lactone hydrolase
MNDMNKLSLGTHEVDIIVTGFPGKSLCHGSLGFSTIALIRCGERIALLDVGSFGQRALLQDALTERGLTPDDVTDVLLTHSHYDHAINWVMFPRARIVIGGEELDWSLTAPWGKTVVPELYMRELATSKALHRVADSDEVFPGIHAHATPGHTPGSLVFVLSTHDCDLIFTGDACKNRAELLSRGADMTYDADVTRESIEKIWALWTAREANILIPGHDVPMRQVKGQPEYLSEREAAIRAWYGETLDQTTIISLT